MQHPIITSPLLVLLLAVIVVSGHVPVPARRTGAGHHPFGGHHHQPQQQQQQAQQPQPQQPQPQQQQPHPQQPQPQQQQAQQPQQQQQQQQPPQQQQQQQQQEGAKQLPPQQKEGDTNTNPARMFGWDPERAKQSCGGNSYCLMKQEFLNAHNWVRQYNFKLPALTWDDNLARSAGQYAQNRAKDCRTIHSDMPYGENIFWGKKLHWMASDAVYFWYIEKQWYDFVKVTCNAPPNSVGCGHFTQIVWKDSVRLGCAIQTCTDQSLGMLVICEYDPPGNYDNENPLDDNNAKHA